MPFVSRAGAKLDHALMAFAIAVSGRVCADLGSNTGGFVDCLLQRGAAKVYAIETGYGVLDWKLRKDARVVVLERTNALHVELPEPISLVTIDVAWTRQRFILPAAARMLRADASADKGGDVVTLIKPHYEAQATDLRSRLRKGVLADDAVEAVLQIVRSDIAAAGFDMIGLTDSPIRGAKGNRELLAHLKPH